MIKKIEVNIDAYELYTNNIDGTSSTVIAYTEDKNVAVMFKEKSGWNEFRKVQLNEVYHVIDRIDDIEELICLKKREAALAKLTVEDKKVLGLL